jgi:hypothetical protein
MLLNTPRGQSADNPTQTELPADYIELEKRVDALKQVHQKLLDVTYGQTAITL